METLLLPPFTLTPNIRWRQRNLLRLYVFCFTIINCFDRMDPQTKYKRNGKKYELYKLNFKILL